MSNKEPWLAVNLSKIFPGLGQIYSEKRLKGYLIIFSNIALYLIGLWLILSPGGNVVIGVGVLGMTLFLWFWNLFDAYRSATRNNNEEFEAERKQTKDPWLAMFLSQIFLGFGHFYIGKWYLALFFIVLLLIIAGSLSFIYPFVLALVAYLSYILAPVRRERSSRRAIIIALLIAISSLLPTVLALLLRTSVVEARWIPSGAMEPTLHGSPNQWEADKILVDKFSYRLLAPKRGDIVVFSPTQELQKEQYTDAFIKRVIGLPGEKVELRNGKVYINNQPLEEQYVSAQQRTAIDVCISGAQPPFLSQPQTIPPDSYLVLGDNRNSSYDGRCWGVVPRNLIIGKAYKRFFPLDRMGSL
ncbi:signal peptidase I [Scytonema tolypothrichoides VB-61278]|nr:signal peptidase I [Scytonema tolypothrichoides VB-61278]